MEKSQFWQDNALFASKTKINIFWKIFEWRVPEGDQEWRIFLQKMLISVFEVIVQPHPNTHLKLDFFPHFSSLCITRLFLNRWLISIIDIGKNPVKKVNKQLKRINSISQSRKNIRFIPFVLFHTYLSITDALYICLGYLVQVGAWKMFCLFSPSLEKHYPCCENLVCKYKAYTTTLCSKSSMQDASYQ